MSGKTSKDNSLLIPFRKFCQFSRDYHIFVNIRTSLRVMNYFGLLCGIQCLVFFQLFAQLCFLRLLLSFPLLPACQTQFQIPLEKMSPSEEGLVRQQNTLSPICIVTYPKMMDGLKNWHFSVYQITTLTELRLTKLL